MHAVSLRRRPRNYFLRKPKCYKILSETRDLILFSPITMNMGTYLFCCHNQYHFWDLLHHFQYHHPAHTLFLCLFRPGKLAAVQLMRSGYRFLSCFLIVFSNGFGSGSLQSLCLIEWQLYQPLANRPEPELTKEQIQLHCRVFQLSHIAYVTFSR